MTTIVNRREFILKSTSLAVGGALLSHAALRPVAAQGGLMKGACIGVLPKQMTVLEKFQAAKTAGFEGVEPNTIKSPEEVQQYKEAAEKTGLKITSIMNSDHWNFPLSDPDPEVVKKSLDCMETSMHNARDLGADAVLLVPGVVNAQVGYADCYKRSQEQIKKLLPLAQQLKVIIACENVGNRFLLSPLEFSRYVDEFNSPWVKAYFDIGNIVSTGFPQDWIRTLGKRIVRFHIKRMEPGAEQAKFDAKSRNTQGIDWPEVRKAISEVGYSGWVTAEVRSGDDAYLKELSERMTRIFDGQNPAA